MRLTITWDVFEYGSWGRQVNIKGLTITWDVFEFGKVDNNDTGRNRLTITWDVFEYRYWTPAMVMRPKFNYNMGCI